MAGLFPKQIKEIRSVGMLGFNRFSFNHHYQGDVNMTALILNDQKTVPITDYQFYR